MIPTMMMYQSLSLCGGTMQKRYTGLTSRKWSALTYQPVTTITLSGTLQLKRSWTDDKKWCVWLMKPAILWRNDLCIKNETKSSDFLKALDWSKMMTVHVTTVLIVCVQRLFWHKEWETFFLVDKVDFFRHDKNNIFLLSFINLHCNINYKSFILNKR